MRFLLLLLAMLFCNTACSDDTYSEHHVLPDGYRGLYRVAFDDPDGGGHLDGQPIDTYKIPENGTLNVQSLPPAGMGSGFTAEYADGTPITTPPYPVGLDPDVPRATGIAADGVGQVYWYAVGTEEHVESAIKAFRKGGSSELERLLDVQRSTAS